MKSKGVGGTPQPKPCMGDQILPIVLLWGVGGGKDMENNVLAIEKIQGNKNESSQVTRKQQEFSKWNKVLYLGWEERE